MESVPVGVVLGIVIAILMAYSAYSSAYDAKRDAAAGLQQALRSRDAALDSLIGRCDELAERIEKLEKKEPPDNTPTRWPPNH